jgi:glycosyltransferase involved in cell wall biosynthesis
MTHPVRIGAMPLVSVIIPVYSRLNYVEQSIRSVLQQSHKDVEVVVVDDGSPNDPGPVVAPFEPRVRLIRQENGGQASARNAGARIARGDLLLFLDDDDFLEPEALEVLLAALSSHPGANWAAGRFHYVDESGRRLERRHPCEFESGNLYPQMIRENPLGPPSTVLMRIELFRTLGGFDESRSVQSAEDYDLWIGAARSAPLAALRCAVTNYRIHPKQITTANSEQHWRALIEVLQKQKSRSPSSDWPSYDHTIAGQYRGLGDEYYLTNRAADARRAWRSSMQADPSMSGWPMRFRFLKSRLPFPLLRSLRTIAGGIRHRLAVEQRVPERECGGTV